MSRAGVHFFLLIWLACFSACTKITSISGTSSSQNPSVDPGAAFDRALLELAEPSKLFTQNPSSSALQKTTSLDSLGLSVKQNCGVVDWTWSRTEKTCAAAKAGLYADIKLWSRDVQSACVQSHGKYANRGKQNTQGTSCKSSNGLYSFEQKISAECKQAESCGAYFSAAKGQRFIDAHPSNPPTSPTQPIDPQLPAVHIPASIDGTRPFIYTHPRITADGPLPEEEDCKADDKGTEPARCGDGNVGSGEECDDGNLYDGDRCSSSCVIEPEMPSVCGDGMIQGEEECDNATSNGTGDCSSNCHWNIESRRSLEPTLASLGQFFLKLSSGWFSTRALAEEVTHAPFEMVDYDKPPTNDLRPVNYPQGILSAAARGKSSLETIFSPMPGCPAVENDSMIACVVHREYPAPLDFKYYLTINPGCTDGKKTFFVNELFPYSPSGNPEENKVRPANKTGVLHLTNIDSYRLSAPGEAPKTTPPDDIYAYLLEMGKGRNNESATELKLQAFINFMEHVKWHENQHIAHMKEMYRLWQEAMNNPQINREIEAASASEARTKALNAVNEYLKNRIPAIIKAYENCTTEFHKKEYSAGSRQMRLHDCLDPQTDTSSCSDIPEAEESYTCDWPADEPIN